MHPKKRNRINCLRLSKKRAEKQKDTIDTFGNISGRNESKSGRGKIDDGEVSNSNSSDDTKDDNAD